MCIRDSVPLAQQHGEEVPGLLDRGGDLVPAAHHRPAPADQHPRVQGGQAVQGGGGPVAVEGVPGVQGGLRLHQVTGEQDPLTGQPGHEVALGVAAARVAQHQLAPVAAEVDAELGVEGERWPGQAGDGRRLPEQPGHPGQFRLPVLPAALGDQRPGPLVGDDHVGVERARAEHAHRVVVAEHQVAHGLVGVLAQRGQPLAGRHRRGQRLEADEEVLALDGADVGVTLGGECVHPVGEHLQGLLLGGEIRGRGKGFLAHLRPPPLVKALTNPSRRG